MYDMTNERGMAMVISLLNPRPASYREIMVELNRMGNDGWSFTIGWWGLDKSKKAAAYEWERLGRTRRGLYVWAVRAL